MSIATRTGDTGTTGLMYNRRVSKSHPRVEAYGGVDELTSALGVAKAANNDPAARAFVEGVQKDLVILMGELATAAEDLERYREDGYKVVGPELTAALDAQVDELEARGASFSGWATPGGTAAAASLDLARSVGRRAERSVCRLAETPDETVNTEIIVYLNRLSDVLWLLARAQE